MDFNYTEVYKKIYKEIKTDQISHDKAHRAALKITNTIMDIYAITLDEKNKLSDVVLETISSFQKAG